MLTYTTWSESGGVGKTTFAVNLAAAHERRGYDVLVIDMDSQDGGFTDHTGMLDLKYENPTNNIVEHMVEQATGEFDEIIHTHPVDGFDFIPSHDVMRYLGEKLSARANLSKGREAFEPNHALRRLLEKQSVHEQYDILIVDPPTKPSPELRNTMYATRNILAPLEVSSKGETSINGVKSEKNSLEDDLEVDIGVYGLVPNEVSGQSNIGQNSLKRIQESQSKLLSPIVIGERESLLGGAWDASMSAFSFAEREKDRLYSRERDTLQKLQYLADIITDDVDQQEMAPEDMGDVVKRPTEHRIHDDFKEQEEDEEHAAADTATGDD